MGDAFDWQLENSLREIKKGFADRPDRVSVDNDRKFVGLDAYQKVINSGVDLVVLATARFPSVHFGYGGRRENMCLWRSLRRSMPWASARFWRRLKPRRRICRRRAARITRRCI
jgi:hypothetical protein